MHPSLRTLLLLFGLWGTACTTELMAQSAPEGFIVEKVVEGVTEPVGCAFAPDGSLFIWTKLGQVYLYQDGQLLPEPVLDISEEVAYYGDLGMLGLALHPDFTGNGYLYVSYVVDRHHLLYFGTPDYDPDEDLFDRATIGRITRFQLDPAQRYQRVVPGSREVLLGKDRQARLAFLHNSHSVGSLAFGDDGSLLAGFGDGSTWEGVYTGGGPPYYNEDVERAIRDGMIPENEDVGAYRAQMLEWHNGKILRMDPETGAGLADNPFYDPSDPFSARSRTWALGIRNPYRFTVRPGTGSDAAGQEFPGTLYIGDVSFLNREELNIVPYAGANLGWPLYEGEFPAGDYFSDQKPHPTALNPLGGQDGCPTNFTFANLLLPRDPRSAELRNPCDPTQPMPADLPTFHHKMPDLYWKHHWSGPTTYATEYNAEGYPTRRLLSDPQAKIQGDMFYGSASMGGAFYSGEAWPEEYHDNYFHLDYQGWIRRMVVDLNDTIQRVEPFIERENKLVDLTMGPDDCLYFIEYRGAVYRVCYGRNVKPQARFEVSRAYGDSPLEVAFTDQSSDPNGDTLQYLWSFGDGGTSTLPNPVHRYAVGDDTPTTFEASLRVSDQEGQTDTYTRIISLNNSPPQVRITTLREGDKYADAGGLLLDLDQEASDAESPVEDLDFHWTTYLHHNFHYHFDRELFAPHGTLYISSVGCDNTVPAIYYYRVEVTATDPHGLSATDTVFIYPECEADIEFTGLQFADHGSPELQWQLRSTDTVASFSVQRATGDWNFREIALVEPVNAPLPFPETFSAALSDRREGDQFRVKYYTTGGAFGYSPVITWQSSAQPVVIHGNPVGEQLRFQVVNYQGPVQAEIMDLQGRTLREEALAGDASALYSLPAKDLPVGVYLLRVRSSEATHTVKFVKAP